MEKETDITIDPFTKEKYQLVEMVPNIHYRMKVPCYERMQSTDLIFSGACPNFTTGVIIVTGDLCPGRNGVVSDPGYGFDFFSKPRGEMYLAEKFLSKGWHKEVAYSDLDDLIEQDKEGDEVLTQDLVEKLKGLIEDGDIHSIYGELSTLGYDSEDFIGYGYDPQELRLLSLINRRFSALVKEASEFSPELRG